MAIIKLKVKKKTRKKLKLYVVDHYVFCKTREENTTLEIYVKQEFHHFISNYGFIQKYSTHEYTKHTHFPRLRLQPHKMSQ